MKINKIIFIIGLCITQLIACAASNTTLSNISIDKQGQSIESRPAMALSCKGFTITPALLLDFYQHATLSDNENAEVNPLKLPCFTAGTAELSNQDIQWTIRAGGIGEFNFADGKRLTKICGIKCCKKLKGIC